MANSNRVFVSPGVYTSEKDLTFVAQSVGITTLGLVGETLTGPAFEPILISNYDEFRTFFGGSSPEKDGSGNPKYELPYFAKSYLQESNQLFVTRILGLTGYKPYKSFGVKTLGGVTVDRTSYTTEATDTMDPLDSTTSAFYADLSGKTSIDGISITDYVETNFSGLTSADDGTWFVLGLVDGAELTGATGTEVVSPLSGKLNANNTNQKEWYNVLYTQTGATDATIDGVYSYLFIYNSGTSVFDVTQFKYSASLNTDYADVTVASIRSRGHYSGNTLTLEVTGNTSFLVSSSEVASNALGDFTINVTGATGGAKTFTCSLDSTSTKYIKKVLGSEVYDRTYSEFPIYAHEAYPNFVKAAFSQGLIRGLSVDEVYHLEGNDYLKSWDTTLSPMVVSEVRGGNVNDLFEVITISDGDNANFEVKVTIMNIDMNTNEFDVLVRDFNDTDDNMVVLEKFSRCSMDPSLPGYVAKKIGTSDGEYELKSRFIMLNMAESHPTDAFPAGFKGFPTNDAFSGTTLGNVIYKTNYFEAGDVMFYEADGTEFLSNAGDKYKKVTLGLSTQTGYTFDADLLKFKGSSAAGVTYGFHMSTNASTILDGNGKQIYQTTSYDLEGQTGTNNKLTSANYRKFTLAVAGGFDGWDIYRNVRTYGDDYIYNKAVYNANTTANGGVFSATSGNSDYYSYLQGIQVYANPEAIDINVFATPGINFYDHNSLTIQAIDMVENDRADSLYIISAPNATSADLVTEQLDYSNIDSNYSSTYWPWIQVKDADTGTQLFVPPTGEVLKNIALTDNVAYPWFAVAGYSRGLVNSVKASKKLTLDERDTLYSNRINPIATFSDTGTIIWGNKTLQVRESPLDRINVRRLLIRARKLISAVAVRLLFEQNDDQVRQEFLRLVNPILESIKKERGLNEFRVTVSNDPEDIDANTLRGKIYIKPTRSLEYIDLEFVITPSGASFENI